MGWSGCMRVEARAPRLAEEEGRDDGIATVRPEFDPGAATRDAREKLAQR
jgi:hypothetical protein